MQLFFNPLYKQYKSVIGAVKRTETVVFKVETSKVDNCLFLFVKDGGELSTFPMQKNANGFEFSLKVDEVGLYYYAFEVDGHRFGFGYDFNAKMDVDDMFHLTVYDENYETPEWIKGGLIYQIFPDRFCRVGINNPEHRKMHDNFYEMPEWRPNEKGQILNDDFFGGNFKGIESKLDYLQELGVRAIYLNPIAKSFSNHRYDTGDYMKIDPVLGTDEDFIRLTEKAEEKGIRIILDGVYNHTGDNSRYFNRFNEYDEVGAYQSKDSKYFPWYCFTEHPDEYQSWWGFKSLPTINKDSKEFREFITGEKGVISHFTDMGSSGYRLDVVDELPDDFVEQIRTAVKRKDKDNFLIGEVWENASDKIAYGVRRKYFLGKELDSVMNYPLRNGIIDFVKYGNGLSFKRAVEEMVDNFPKEASDCLMNLSGTHDSVRLITELGGIPAENREEMSKTTLTGEKYDEAVKGVKQAMLLLFTVCGVPSVYYGDEIGMQGYKDPFNRQTFGSQPVNGEIYEFVKKLSKIRNKIELFKDGGLEFEFADKKTVIFNRNKDGRKVYIGVNNSFDDVKIHFNGTLFNLLDDSEHNDGFTLKPWQSCILYDEKIN